MEVSQQTMVVEHLPLVRLVASQAKSHLPPHYLGEDLEQYGVLGLIDAVKRYDSSRGVPFAVYAKRRIYGAIMDNVRKQEWLPRSIMEKAKQVERGKEALRARLQREPNQQELARQLGMRPEELALLEQQQQAAGFLSLDKELGYDEDGDNLTLLDLVDSQIDVEEQVGRRELLQRLRNALLELPERERLLITLYYYEELTLREISEVLGVSESRVCQLHKRALKQLKVLLS